VPTLDVGNFATNNCCQPKLFSKEDDLLKSLQFQGYNYSSYSVIVSLSAQGHLYHLIIVPLQSTQIMV